MKVMLLFPPNWTPTMPHLALPTLTAYLRGQGAEVIQRDLNVEIFDQILTRDHMKGVLNQLRNSYDRHGRSRQPRAGRPLPKPEVVQWALRRGPELLSQVENAKQIVRSEAFFDGPLGF